MRRKNRSAGYCGGAEEIGPSNCNTSSWSTEALYRKSGWILECSNVSGRELKEKSWLEGYEKKGLRAAVTLEDSH